MYKKISSVLAVVVVLTLLATTTISVFAQEGTQDPNTPVSNVGGVLSLPEASGTTSSTPFRGNGELSSSSVAGPGTSAAGVESAYPESVIAPDSRTKVTTTTVYPSRAIAYLLVTWANNSQGSCTGWFIGPRTVATAGHCVWNTAAGAAHGWAKSIVVYPGRNGAYLPYGSTTAHQLFSVTGWTTSGSSNYDYGAIEVNSPKGNTVGYFGFHWQSSNSFPGTFTVRGYPGDKPTATMWTMNGLITHVNTYRLWYTIDTFGGQSGSPLYHLINNVCCYGEGVHTYGTSVSPYYGNSSTRITQSVFNNFVSWKASAYP